MIYLLNVKTNLNLEYAKDFNDNVFKYFKNENIDVERTEVVYDEGFDESLGIKLNKLEFVLVNKKIAVFKLPKYNPEVIKCFRESIKNFLMSSYNDKCSISKIKFLITQFIYGTHIPISYEWLHVKTCYDISYMFVTDLDSCTSSCMFLLELIKNFYKMFSNDNREMKYKMKHRKKTYKGKFLPAIRFAQPDFITEFRRIASSVPSWREVLRATKERKRIEREKQIPFFRSIYYQDTGVEQVYINGTGLQCRQKIIEKGLWKQILVEDYVDGPVILYRTPYESIFENPEDDGAIYSKEILNTGEILATDLKSIIKYIKSSHKNDCEMFLTV